MTELTSARPVKKDALQYAVACTPSGEIALVKDELGGVGRAERGLGEALERRCDIRLLPFAHARPREVRLEGARLPGVAQVLERGFELLGQRGEPRRLRLAHARPDDARRARGGE